MCHTDVGEGGNKNCETGVDNKNSDSKADGPNIENGGNNLCCR